ncbi:Galactokinase, putative [Pediculus humanus corporis]|uniref:Galactokinase, putative n=1 Tax=Pediculus humanus subsp. corporis TaxID=121224 RepID=E0VP18_PEDHC|nr:Galactokinase, putative [Pediculus humanus corporis]EEB15123.1 Galactokinase, putative [Pediculus humanus corporis]
MFVTRTDFLRTLFAQPIPSVKTLTRKAMEEFQSLYGNQPEAIGVAPGNITLFGEFMEFHLGYIICMALPMVVVTVGGRNDSVYFSVKTLSKKVEKPNTMKSPLPCVRTLKNEERNWVNSVIGCVSEFKGHVPGFNAVITSSLPIKFGFRSCSALQASIYTFLENLTQEYSFDLFEKADRCTKTEHEIQLYPSELISKCSSIKFFPTFICKEGHLMFINCKRHKISQYFFDHPSYVFLLGSCKNNTSTVTIESLDKRLRKCIKALEILGRNSLLNADLKHLRCLRKRDASEETIKRVKYVITEHQRTEEAIKAIKSEDYERLGALMNQSHVSLRDDYEVSSPQIETLINLAKKVKGVLGAKMIGNGLNATIIILVKITEAENCIRYIRKNYKPKEDKPFFFVTKPSEGAFMMNPNTDLTIIP